MSHYAAIDLGAESGRIIVGTIEDNHLTLSERHRFPTGGQHDADGSYRWDIDRIAEEIFCGLRTLAQAGPAIRSVSTDSWGVDYVWLDAAGNLLALPFHYRDDRNTAAQARVFEKITRKEIFAETGLQFLPFNTLYQFEADLHNNTVPQGATQSLLIADYINFLLSGQAVAEESLASTTQLYNPIQRNWSSSLANAINLPQKLLPPIVPPASILSSRLRQTMAEKTGLPEETAVIATCSHDTGAAIFAIPAETGESWAYISSGTWSLIGAELDTPVINPEVLAANYTNEIGYNHTSRFLKNLVGMWILQECRRTWSAEGVDYTYAQLQKLAEESAPLQTFIHPNAPRFSAPGDMPEKIAAFARETNQPVPQTHGETIRCVLESLALLYSESLGKLESLTGRTFNTLHVVGGGAQNTLLNQFTADASQRRLIAGPVEATAIGNILLQALALGDIPDHAAARQIVRASFPMQTYTPTNAAIWANARRHFAKINPV